MENGVLFEVSGEEGSFYAHIQVRNETDAGIGVDLGAGAGGIRPIQYAALDTPVMEVIDIRCPVIPAVTDSLSAAVAAAYSSGGLTILGPGEAVEYYGEFDGSGREEIDAMDCRWLMIAYGGFITATDGSTTESIAPEDGFVYIPARFPVTWAGVPSE